MVCNGRRLMTVPRSRATIVNGPGVCSNARTSAIDARSSQCSVQRGWLFINAKTRSYRLLRTRAAVCARLFPCHALERLRERGLGLIPYLFRDVGRRGAVPKHCCRHFHPHQRDELCGWLAACFYELLI